MKGAALATLGLSLLTARQRILRETSAYYLLAVEPIDADRDGRIHYITVKTSVKGADVRARRTLVIPAR